MQNANSGIVRGFAKTKEQEATLRAHGLPDKEIYLDGRGAESLEVCLETFRGRPGILIIASDLRVLAATKRGVSDMAARLEKAGIRAQDLSNPGDDTQAAMVHRAHVAISAARFQGNRPRARRQGRAGGFAKGVAAEGARSGLAPEWLVDNIVNEDLTWEQRLRILGGKFSEATLRRHYGYRAAAKRA